MVELGQQPDQSPKFPRRQALFRVATVAGVAAGILRNRPAEAGGVRPLKKEGVQLVDDETPGITVEANHNPLIADGTLKLHICIEDQGVADITSRQITEVAGTSPGYLVVNHKEPYDNSCFDVNMVTGQARGEIDEVLLGKNGSESKTVYRYSRDQQGNLSGEYRGGEVIDLSKIHPRDQATPQPQ